MKKILPVIIILIGLSLLGLVILQASWLNNLLKIRQQQVSEKIAKAESKVVQELSKEINNSNSIKIPKTLQSLSLKDDYIGNKFRLKLISHQYSLNEVKELIDKELKIENVKNLPYEFAMLDNQDAAEMLTKNFEKYFYDTANAMRFAMPISESGTDFENMGFQQKLIIVVPNFETYVWGSLTLILLGSGLFTIIIFAAFYITVRTLLNQKKLSEIKSDFINNMTHEFKTPLATISLAVDAIRNEKVQNDPIKLQYFSTIIKEENKRMNAHVETILQAALLEKKEFQFKIKKTNAHLLIATVVDNFQLQLQEKKGICKLELNANNDCIEVDELHFSSAISNLVDNAIKYSKENLEIKISSFNKNDSLVIKIEDNGIGMNKETAKNVFEKFYRAHTGNVHNVKGFGLGMSYVKTIIDEFEGSISVASTLGKGTTFTIEMPVV